MSVFEQALRILTQKLNAKNDGAHNNRHVNEVLNNAREINSRLGAGVPDNIIVTMVLCHDIGYSIDKDKHHILSAQWVDDNKVLFPISILTEEEIGVIKTAILNHRASIECDESTLDTPSRILRAADMGSMNVDKVILRAYTYQRDRYDDCNLAYELAVLHVRTKYSDLKVSNLWTMVHGEFPHKRIRELDPYPYTEAVEDMERRYQKYK